MTAAYVKIANRERAGPGVATEGNRRSRGCFCHLGQSELELEGRGQLQDETQLVPDATLVLGPSSMLRRLGGGSYRAWVADRL